MFKSFQISIAILKDSGRMEDFMVSDQCIFQMDQFILVPSKTIKRLDKEDIFIRMDLSMKGRLEEILQMDMGNTLTITKITPTKENG